MIIPSLHMRNLRQRDRLITHSGFYSELAKQPVFKAGLSGTNVNTFSTQICHSPVHWPQESIPGSCHDHGMTKSYPSSSEQSSQ